MLNYGSPDTYGTVCLFCIHFQLQHLFYGIYLYFANDFGYMICDSFCHPFMDYRIDVNTSHYSISHPTWDFQLWLWLWFMLCPNFYNKKYLTDNLYHLLKGWFFNWIFKSSIMLHNKRHYDTPSFYSYQYSI